MIHVLRHAPDGPTQITLADTQAKRVLRMLLLLVETAPAQPKAVLTHATILELAKSLAGVLKVGGVL